MCTGPELRESLFSKHEKYLCRTKHFFRRTRAANVATLVSFFPLINYVPFLRDYGVLVELLPNSPSVLLHCKELDHNRVGNKRLSKLDIPPPPPPPPPQKKKINIIKKIGTFSVNHKTHQTLVFKLVPAVNSYFN